MGKSLILLLVAICSIPCLDSACIRLNRHRVLIPTYISPKRRRYNLKRIVHTFHALAPPSSQDKNSDIPQGIRCDVRYPRHAEQ
ncbi:hypothetical protein BDV40DRAFT_261263 [Aspergillus tamarii]|uniref:Secreted protein n=1 Tax=Aspergillus tamarii TaxID=41984 RepID=A0A5N6UZC1_ASPTM|nr:hypothetical protein BDV40DRAFT_261263 [Aspergillus tamarii]